MNSPTTQPTGLRLPSLGALVNGEWLSAESTFPVCDKYTGGILAEVPESTTDQVGMAVRALADGVTTRQLPPHRRAAVLNTTADLIQQRRAEFAGLMTAEAGFTQADVDGEIDRALITLRLSAEESTRITGETVAFGSAPGQHNRLGFTIRVPLGVVCAITPFNSPLNTVLHKLAPAIAGGNAVILKPSALTPLTAAMLCATFLDAGLPPELIALVHGGGDTVGARLLAEQDIAFYSFTGSSQVGRQIQHGAGLRRTQLELGSIASTIVCADADLGRAVPKIANAAFRKAGQVCTSVQRLYVEQSVMDDVSERLVAAAVTMPAGDPRAPETKVGPMISTSAAERVQLWIAEARGAGAEVLHGDSRTGPVHGPTVLLRAGPGMRVIDREVFGPLVSLLPFTELDEAVRGANSTPFGLAAGFFSSDIDKAMTAARSLRFGSVHLNETSSSRADAMPFGGVKDSGSGHEGPRYAIREVTEERLITLNP